MVVALWGRLVVLRAQGRPVRPAPAWAAWAFLVVIVVFGVLRNVPALAPWLAP